MAPRKAAAPTDESVAPRRSSRAATVKSALGKTIEEILITALGAGEGGKTKRSHFIFAKGGKLIDKKIPVKPEDSSKLALKFVKSQ